MHCRNNAYGCMGTFFDAGTDVKGRTPSKQELKHMQLVADSGCIVCSNEMEVFSPAAILHIDDKTKPGCHYNILPLCGAHHQTGGYGVALHAGRAEWESLYGTQRELLIQVNKEIYGEDNDNRD